MSSYEPGSPECRSLIDAKENIINAMKALNSINDLDDIQERLRKVYNELEAMHQIRREKEMK